MNFKGLGVAVITPFTRQMEVDYTSLKKILNYLIENGTDYLVMLGTTSEAATLTADEKQKVLDTALEVNDNRLPIVLGLGGNNTSVLLQSIQKTNFKGISAILSVCPYYNKPNQTGLYEHFKAIASESPVPVILYNVPGRTSSNLAAETTLKLAEDFENIIAIKEASGDFNQIMKILQYKPSHFQVLSGDDALTLPLLSVGAEGVISVIGNAYPAAFSAMVHNYLDGKINAARDIHYQLLEMVHLIFSEGNPTGIKMLMHLKGFCEPYLRLPLVSMSEKGKEKIQNELNKILV